MVDQMQLVRFDDPEYLTCELTLECADLGNDAAFRQPFQEGGSVRDDRTVMPETSVQNEVIATAASAISAIQTVCF